MNNRNKAKNNFERYLGIPYYVVMTILVVIPIFLLVLSSFQTGTSSSLFPFTFSFKNYQMFFSTDSFVNSMSISLWIAFGTTILCLLIGYPIAYILTKLKTRTQIALILLFNAPMWINSLLRIRALKQIMELFVPGMIGTPFAIIVGLAYIYLPFMVLPIYAVLAKIDRSLLESSADLGANRFQTLSKVVIPLSLSGVISGIMMVFLPAATTIIVPKYLDPDVNYYMIGILIERSIIEGEQIPYSSAIAIVLSAIILAFVYYIKKIDRYKGVNANEAESR